MVPYLGGRRTPLLDPSRVASKALRVGSLEWRGKHACSPTQRMVCVSWRPVSPPPEISSSRLRSWAERKAADPEIACASIKSCSCSATPWIGGVVGCKVVMRDWDFDACHSAWFSYRWSVPGGFSSRLVFVTPSGKALLGLAAVQISDWPMRVSCIIWAPASLGTLRCSVRCRQLPAAAAKFRLLAYASVAAGSLSSQLAPFGE